MSASDDSKQPVDVLGSDASTLESAADRPTLIRRVTRYAANQLGAQRAALLFDPKPTDALPPVCAFFGFDGEIWTDGVSRNLLKKLMRASKSTLVMDSRQDANYLLEEGPRSLLAVPLRDSSGALRGLLYADHQKPAAFDYGAREKAEALGMLFSQRISGLPDAKPAPKSKPAAPTQSGSKALVWAALTVLFCVGLGLGIHRLNNARPAPAPTARVAPDNLVTVVGEVNQEEESLIKLTLWFPELKKEVRLKPGEFEFDQKLGRYRAEIKVPEGKRPTRFGITIRSKTLKAARLRGLPLRKTSAGLVGAVPRVRMMVPKTGESLEPSRVGRRRRRARATDDSHRAFAEHLKRLEAKYRKNPPKKAD